MLRIDTVYKMIIVQTNNKTTKNKKQTNNNRHTKEQQREQQRNHIHVRMYVLKPQLFVSNYKCRMLNLKFLRDSYVTWERKC